MALLAAGAAGGGTAVVLATDGAATPDSEGRATPMAEAGAAGATGAEVADGAASIALGRATSGDVLVAASGRDGRLTPMAAAGAGAVARPKLEKGDPVDGLADGAPGRVGRETPIAEDEGEDGRETGAGAEAREEELLLNEAAPPATGAVPSKPTARLRLTASARGKRP